MAGIPREGEIMEPNATQGVLSNMMNWDPVAWMSILMVVIAVVIVVFLSFKVKNLMNRDAEEHQKGQ